MLRIAPPIIISVPMENLPPGETLRLPVLHKPPRPLLLSWNCWSIQPEISWLYSPFHCQRVAGWSNHPVVGGLPVLVLDKSWPHKNSPSPHRCEFPNWH